MTDTQALLDGHNALYQQYVEARQAWTDAAAKVRTDPSHAVDGEIMVRYDVAARALAQSFGVVAQVLPVGTTIQSVDSVLVVAEHNGQETILTSDGGPYNRSPLHKGRNSGELVLMERWVDDRRVMRGYIDPTTRRLVQTAS